MIFIVLFKFSDELFKQIHLVKLAWTILMLDAKRQGEVMDSGRLYPSFQNLITSRFLILTVPHEHLLWTIDGFVSSRTWRINLEMYMNVTALRGCFSASEPSL